MILGSELQRAYSAVPESERVWVDLRAGMLCNGFLGRQPDDAIVDAATSSVASDLAGPPAKAREARAVLAAVAAHLLVRRLARRGEAATVDSVLRTPGTVDETGEADQVRVAERRVRIKVPLGQIRTNGMMVLPDGIDINGYRANPVVLWAHGRDQVRNNLPIGRSDQTTIGRDDAGRPYLSAVVRFSPARDPFVKDLWGLISDGLVRGFEPRFLPQEWRQPTKTEADRSGGKLKLVIIRSELVEISCTALADDREATYDAIVQGRSIAPALRRSLRTARELISASDRLH